MTECLLYESSFTIDHEVTIDDRSYECESERENQEIEIIDSSIGSKNISTNSDNDRTRDY